MELVVIHGSPRRGNTYEATQYFIKTMQSLGSVQLTEFFLPQDMPEFCRGCFACIVKGEDKCPHAKYIAPIVQAMDAADGFIMTSPVYVLQLSGGMKAFLDHLAYAYINHRPRFFNKKAVVIATTAGAGLGNCLNYLSQNLRFWGVNKVYRVGIQMMAIDWDTMDHKKSAKAKARLAKTAKIFFEDLLSGKVHSPSLIQAVMFSVSKSLMHSFQDDSVDKEYWRTAGWLSHRTQYFSPKFPLGPVRWTAGKLAALGFGAVTKSSIRTESPPSPQKPIYVVEYDPKWPAIFNSLRDEIVSVLGEVAVSVEHVGSTSVPGLAAKPVIDIDIVIKRESLPRTIELLATLGYVHVGNQGILDREAFKYSSDKPTHHLYVCPEDSAELQKHLTFRDYLRTHPDVSRQYGLLKQKLAEQYRNDRVTYTEAKTEYIVNVMKDAATQRALP